MSGPRWLVGFLVLSSFLAAADGMAGVIEERRALMRDLGHALQAIWDGLARGEADMVEQGARHIAARANRIVPLFPPGSFHSPSRAQPVSPEEVPSFTAFAQDLREAAEALAASAGRERFDEVRPRLARLVQTCRECHRSYIRPY